MSQYQSLPNRLKLGIHPDLTEFLDTIYETELIQVFSACTVWANDPLLYSDISNISKNFNFIRVSVLKPDKISYLSMKRFMGKYCPDDDPSAYPRMYNPDGIWEDTNQRQVMKIGKLIKGIIEEAFAKAKECNDDIPLDLQKAFDMLSPQSYEEVSNKFKAHFELIYSGDDNQFKVVSGNDILTYYHENSYALMAHELGSSCMRYAECQDYLGIYTSNPDKIQLMILLDKNGKLKARALLWNYDDKFLVDRIYAISDHIVTIFRSEALNRGYYVKTNSQFRDKNDNEMNMRLDIPLKHTSFEQYPYMDSFMYLTIGTGVSTYDGDYTLDFVEGYLNEEACESCGTHHDLIGETHHGGSLCDACGTWDDLDHVAIYQEDSVVLSCGDTTHLDNSVFSEHRGEYLEACRAFEVTLPNGFQDWALSGDCVYSDHYQAYILDEDVVEVKLKDGDKYVMVYEEDVEQLIEDDVIVAEIA